jgi:hypothetical protein
MGNPCRLPKHECAIRALHAAGKSDKEICMELCLKKSTVSTYRRVLGLKPNRKYIMSHKPFRHGSKEYDEQLEKECGYSDGHDTDVMYHVYKEEETEFLKAIASFVTRHHRHPSFVEALGIAKKLGWSRPCMN